MPHSVQFTATSSLPSGFGPQARNPTHSLNQPYEVLLPMRTHHGGRTALLQPLRPKLHDVKLCPRHHQNPRGAEGCSQCGSRELSTPQPKLPMSWRLAALLLQFVLGILLVYGSLSLLIALIRTPQFQQFLVATGLLVGGAWWCYSKLLDWLQKLIRAICGGGGAMRTERGNLSGFGENANEPEIKRCFMPSEVEQSYPRVRQIGDLLKPALCWKV